MSTPFDVLVSLLFILPVVLLQSGLILLSDAMLSAFLFSSSVPLYSLLSLKYLSTSSFVFDVLYPLFL